MLTVIEIIYVITHAAFVNFHALTLKIAIVHIEVLNFL